MAAPTMTYNAAGNVLSESTSVAGNANTTATIDLSTKFGAWIDVLYTTTGTVQATNGLKVEAFAGYGTGPSYGTVADVSYQFAAQAINTTNRKAIWLDTGKWQIKLTNLDTVNSVTVGLTSATVDTVA